jgi:uncharacterized membrane protein YecN with MAPEG domain
MDTIASGHAAALWVGLHVLLLLTLSLLVVRLRQKHKVALGDEGIPELARAIRAFGNASEYIPVGLARSSSWPWSAPRPWRSTWWGWCCSSAG